MNIQLFGLACPPLYGEEEAMETIEKISKVDEQINDLMIKRAMYVEDLKKQINKD